MGKVIAFLEVVLARGSRFIFWSLKNMTLYSINKLVAGHAQKHFTLCLRGQCHRISTCKNVYTLYIRVDNDVVIQLIHKSQSSMC